MELFHTRNARKLSLRFLASYLLNLDIQAVTHDSITDARTALQLFQVQQYAMLVTLLPIIRGNDGPVDRECLNMQVMPASIPVICQMAESHSD